MNIRTILIQCLILLMVSSELVAATFTVNKLTLLADINPGDGQCDNDVLPGNSCDLFTAIEEANADPNADIIQFNLVNPEIIVSRNLPPITAPLSFIATEKITLNFDNSSNGLQFINNNNQYFIENIIVKNAQNNDCTATAKGGGISNFGNLQIDDVTLQANNGIVGGAIFNAFGAQLNVNNSVLISNTTGFNLSTCVHIGGAIYNEGTMVISTSEIAQNYSMNNTAGIYNATTASLSMSQTRIFNHSQGGDFYGAINNTGRMQITDSIIEGNQAYVVGGIFSSGDLYISGSSLLNNISSGTPGGAISSVGQTYISNSTINGNTASQYAGAIHVNGGMLVMQYVTVSDNKVDNTINKASAIANDSGQIKIGRSILANNQEFGQNNQYVSAEDCSGDIESLDYNIITHIENPSNCNISGILVNNLINVDPELEPIKINGGFAPSQLLQISSPALNAIPLVDCNPIHKIDLSDTQVVLSTDQRKVTRPNDFAMVTDNPCDIGSIEMAQPAIIALFTSPANTSEDGGTSTIDVRLQTQPQANVQLSITVDNVVEASASPANLNFDESNWYFPQTVTVTGKDDLQADGVVNYLLIITPTSTDSNYANLAALYLELTNLDDDSSGSNMPPQAVMLLSPENAATNIVAQNTPFRWKTATDTDGIIRSYQLYVCDNAQFSNCNERIVNTNITAVFDLQFAFVGTTLITIFLGAWRRRKSVLLLSMILGLMSCSDAAKQASERVTITPEEITYSIANLNPASRYYWKVQAVDNAGAISESLVWEFTTAP